jgi:Kef-type K+ transport system membrane component KefB
MFVAGLEVDLEAMVHSGRPSMIAGILGMAATLSFDFDLQRSLFRVWC